MNVEHIEQLIKLMEQHGLAELQVKSGDLEFKARRAEAVAPVVIHQAPAPVHHAPTPAQTAPSAQKAPAGGEAPGKAAKEILAPIVGTFYRKPNPTAPPYKEVGERVEKDEVVCIIEAMKVMNEIKAEHAGVLKKFLVDDASPVEFGQALYLLEVS